MTEYEKPKCPKCNGKLRGVFFDLSRLQKCDNCNTRWHFNIDSILEVKSDQELVVE